MLSVNIRIFEYSTKYLCMNIRLRIFSISSNTNGGVDVCINNAGLLRPAPLLTAARSDWEDMLNTNVIGLMAVTQAAVASMKDTGIGEGHVINISSISGHRVVNNPDTHFYAASKSAVTALTTGLRHELLTLRPALNCRVSQICPGMVDTPMTAGKPVNYKWLEDDDIANTVIYQLSLPPHAQVQDVISRSSEQPL